MAIAGYLGIDAGTQGLSAIFTNDVLEVLAVGEGGYDMVAGLDDGCYEQRPSDWEAALRQAMEKLRENLALAGIDFTVAAIGISGQMHGEVLADAEGKSLKPARLWCDSRNEQEGELLTAQFGVKMPKRITAARWLWTIRNQPEAAQQAAQLTTPAGWLSYRLTGEWTLGIGDAAGMFPIDQETLDYRDDLLAEFEKLTTHASVRPLAQLLPTVRRVGELAGTLNDVGAQLLGLPVGVPVAPAEGDQPAALAGSLIGEPGMVALSFGTSVCANSVGDRAFRGVSREIDHFCAPDGKPINMAWLRNGTTFMNTIVEMFGQAIGGDRSAGFAAVMPQVLKATPDCGGLHALPFMDDEPAVGVERGGTATIVGLNSDNATPGNVAKAALLATAFNLRIGCEVLETQGYPRTEMLLSGGLTKTPKVGQILADVYRTPVTLLESAEEGTAWGAALLAKFCHQSRLGDTMNWGDFLSSHASGSPVRFEPNEMAASQYDAMYNRYRRLLDLHEGLQKATVNDN